MFLLNAFSASMLPLGFKGNVRFTSLTEREAQNQAGCVVLHSAIGHKDTAEIFARILGVSVEVNRTSVQLTYGGNALLGQYHGPRLAEGTMVLPEGAEIRWFLVQLS